MKVKVNGVELDYQIGGSGPLIAFAHSLGMSKEIFDPLRPTLEQHGRFLTWDARGHGQSQKATGWSVEDLAADLRALIEHVGEDEAVIAGLSMGGNTALSYAVTYPEKTRALIVSDTTAWYGEGAEEAWETRVRKAETNGMAPVIPFNIPRWFSDGFPEKHPEVVEKVSKIILACDVPSYASAGRALGRFNVEDKLDRIKCPTLILVGEEDPATPVSMAENLNRKIKNSELHVLPRLKHMTPVEDPEGVGKLMTEFLRKALA